MNDHASGIHHMPDPYRAAAVAKARRTTAEIVADLREGPIKYSFQRREAADRLAELDATPCPYIEWSDEATNHCSLNCEHDAMRPNCPTCGGTGTSEPVYSGSTIGYVSIVCSDCTDGKVPFERLVAVFNAVFKFTVQSESRSLYDQGWRSCEHHLRGVR